jgi:hypothetical protein
MSSRLRDEVKILEAVREQAATPVFSKRVRIRLEMISWRYWWRVHPAFLYWPWTIERNSLGGTRFRKRVLFQDNFDILIDGFWRSANSFLLSYLRTTNPTLDIRGHLHDPRFVIMAIRFRKPVCVLIRPPRDCMPSFVIHSRQSLLSAIERYITYYKALRSYVDNVLVVSFKTATERPNSVASVLRERFGIAIEGPPIDETLSCNVRRMVRSYPWGDNLLTVSLPEPARTPLAKEIERALDLPDYSKILLEAQLLYDEYAAVAI